MEKLSMKNYKTYNTTLKLLENFLNGCIIVEKENPDYELKCCGYSIKNQYGVSYGISDIISGILKHKFLEIKK